MLFPVCTMEVIEHFQENNLGLSATKAGARTRVGGMHNCRQKLGTSVHMKFHETCTKGVLFKDK